jgi:nitrile hydratase
MPAVETPIAAGSRVRVRGDSRQWHHRTPAYLKGKHGTVECLLGTYRDPEHLAYHRPGLPMRRLYRVRFSQADVWPGYGGPSGDELVADLYEHWLEDPG